MFRIARLPAALGPPGVCRQRTVRASFGPWPRVRAHAITQPLRLARHDRSPDQPRRARVEIWPFGPQLCDLFRHGSGFFRAVASRARSRGSYGFRKQLREVDTAPLANRDRLPFRGSRWRGCSSARAGAYRRAVRSTETVAAGRADRRPRRPNAMRTWPTIRCARRPT